MGVYWLYFNCKLKREAVFQPTCTTVSVLIMEKCNSMILFQAVDNKNAINVGSEVTNWTMPFIFCHRNAGLLVSVSSSGAIDYFILLLYLKFECKIDLLFSIVKTSFISLRWDVAS